MRYRCLKNVLIITQVRVLEIQDEFTRDARNADAIKKACKNNHGQAARLFVQYILKNYTEEEFDKWFEEESDNCKKLLEERCLNGSQLDRLSEFPVILITTAKIAAKAFKLDFSIDGIYEYLIDKSAEKSSDVDAWRKGYNALLEYINTHPNEFIFDEGYDSSIKTNCYGRVYDIKEKSSGKLVKQVCVMPRSFDLIMEKMGVENPDMVVSKCKKGGLMDCEEGKRTTRRTIQKKGGRIAVYAFNYQQEKAEVKEKKSGRVENLLEAKRQSQISKSA